MSRAVSVELVHAYGPVIIRQAQALLQSPFSMYHALTAAVVPEPNFVG